MNVRLGSQGIKARIKIKRRLKGEKLQRGNDQLCEARGTKAYIGAAIAVNEAEALYGAGV